MYHILIKAGTDSDNLWGYYTEKGIWWAANTVDEATAKIETLTASMPASSIRLVQDIAFTIDVAVTVVEPEPEP